MPNTTDRLLEVINDALAAATMERASFGFPNDRIEVKSIHFGAHDSPPGIAAGDELHPDDYVKRITKLYRGSWIVSPLQEALRLVEQNRALLAQLDAVRLHLERSNIPALVELSRAGMREA